MKIVKLKNGKYAIRRWRFFCYEYLDIYGYDYWWTGYENSPFIEEHASGTLAEAEYALGLYKEENIK